MPANVSKAAVAHLTTLQKNKNNKRKITNFVEVEMKQTVEKNVASAMAQQQGKKSRTIEQLTM